MAQQIGSALRQLWVRVALRGVHYSDRHEALNSAYRVPDPWGMETEREAFRFRETNRLIERHIGPVQNLLEVGCGEGHQSRELLRVCQRLSGIDVSGRAVERARERCPAARFEVGHIFECELLEEEPRFDLVVACEVIYYMQDLREVIARLSELGRHCLVTYYEGQSARLDPVLETVPGVRSDGFRFADTSWKAFWWDNDTPA